MTLAVIGSADQSAAHVLVLDAGVPAATARRAIKSTDHGKITGIAVLTKEV